MINRVSKYFPDTIRYPLRYMILDIRKFYNDRQKRRVIKNRTPEFLTIETTTRCNANCRYCGRPKENHDMPLELFKAIVDAASFVKEVRPCARGEPLLYPHLIDAIKYCKSKDKRVMFHTNGSLLDRAYAKRLLSLHVDTIIFSIDDCNTERFSRERKGLQLETVIQNLKNLIELRDYTNSETKIFVRATLTDTNRNHQQEIKEFFSFADSCYFVKQFASTCDYPKHSWTKSRSLFCQEPFTILSVRHNGQSGLCCNDWTDNFSIGEGFTTTVKASDLLEVFQQTREIGKKMIRGLLPVPCFTCRNRWKG